MKILKAILKNYSRFYVSGIKYLEYTPDKKIQSIIGQNGSGKSSLLKELIPNVDNVKNDYDTNGYKHITYEHNDNIIELVYDRDTDKHSFLFNSEELNPAGIITTQKSLIEQYFNLTKDIHGMLLSTKLFTTMSINERKKWFTEILSDIDYTYVLKLYDKSKFRIKELTSFIKLTRSKLIKDNDFLDNLDKDYENKLIYKINKLNSILESLMSDKEPYKDIDKDRIYNNLNTLVLNSHDLFKEITKYDKHIVQNIDTDYIKKTTELDILIKQKDNINEKISKVDNLKVDKDDTKASIENELNMVNNKIDKLKEINIYNIDLDRIDNVVYSFNKILPYIQDVNNNLIELMNSEELLTKDEYNKLVNIIENKNNILRNKNTKLIYINNEINKLNDVSKDTVSCPKCDNVFIPNFDEKVLTNNKVIKDELLKEINVLNKDITILNNRITKYLEINDIKQQFIDLFNNSDLLPIITYILKNTDRLMNVNKINNIINKLNVDINELLKYSNLKRDKDELLNKLKIFTKINDSKLKNIFNRVTELQHEYTSIIEKINILNKELSILKSIKSKLDKLNPMLINIEKIVRSNRSIINNEIKKEKNIFLNKILTDLKREIHILEDDLITVKNIRDRYNTLQKEIYDFELRLKSIKILLDILSPNKGIIGKSVVGLINDILKRMNNLINKVWNYDIKILPCDIDESDLSFKFPVMLNDVKRIKDVSEGSSAIQEIINLAFKVVAMEYLDILDYPLILDEYAAKMDPKHRIEAYNLIEELSKEYFGQVFMVSHFESMYNRFTDNDVIILSNDNLEYDGVFNKVIKIK